jgi:hypothetical protein
MTKRQKLFDWALNKGWFYLSQIPFDNFGMTRQDASTALRDFCKQGRCDFRVVGLKQYKVKDDLRTSQKTS